jgi:hypothetical protein
LFCVYALAAGNVVALVWSGKLIELGVPIR